MVGNECFSARPKPRAIAITRLNLYGLQGNYNMIVY